jgi:SAM-dependent methyltransferase
MRVDPVFQLSVRFKRRKEVQVTLRRKVRERFRRENFCPGWLGVFSNPFFVMRRGIYRAVRELAPDIKGEILDFGCGSKPYETLFTSASQYVGVDVEVSGHDHSNSRIDFFYDGSRLPFDDGKFDAVVSFEVFEHLFNLPEILNELWRVTRDGGGLLVSIPFAWDEHEVPYDFARYTSFGIAAILQEHGYEVLIQRKTTTYIQALGQLLIMYLLHLSPWEGIAGKFFQMFIICPSTIAISIANLLLPRKYSLFSNLVVLARKAVVYTEVSTIH